MFSELQLRLRRARINQGKPAIIPRRLPPLPEVSVVDRPERSVLNCVTYSCLTESCLSGMQSMDMGAVRRTESSDYLQAVRDVGSGLVYLDPI